MFNEWSRPYPHLNPGEPPSNALILRFRDGSVRNERLSADGPAVYDRVFQVMVMAVGQKQSAPIFTLVKVTEGKEKIQEPREHAQFKATFEAWRANVEPSMDGTPLEHWPLMTTELVRAFKDANVLTVEMLASAGDNVAGAVRAPFYEWRAKAAGWLKQAKDAGGDAKARAENAKLRKEVEEMRTQIAELLAVQNGATPGASGFSKKRRKANGANDDIAPIAIPDEAMAEFDEDRL